MIVDPGVGGSELISAALSRLEWQPTAVICTHGHLDHVGAAATLAAVWDIPVYCATADQAMLVKPSNGLGQALSPVIAQLLGEDALPRPADLRDFTDFSTAGLTLRPYPAPGHTQGSTVVVISDDLEAVACTGDVIFAGTIGRTDLPGGDLHQMRSSLRTLIQQLPDELPLLPGHGPATTMRAEKNTNPYLVADYLKD